MPSTKKKGKGQRAKKGGSSRSEKDKVVKAVAKMKKMLQL